MSTWLSRISLVLVGIFVLGGLTFGATQAFGSNMVSACDGLGQLGECPSQAIPDTAACNAACMAEFGNPGACWFGCCNCAI